MSLKKISPAQNRAFHIVSLGCKVNHYETQAMRELFEAAGHTCVPFDAPADAYIVNTCTVTQTSDSKSRQMIARAHRSNPNALVVAVGCYAQVAPEIVSALEGVGLVLGTSGRTEIVSRVEQGDRLTRGQRFGLIKFGSRLDVYLPEGYEAAVPLGEKVLAGSSVIARKIA